MSTVSFLAVVFSGVLAGEELIVRWGLAPALRHLAVSAHLQARVALVRRLRIVVPVLIVPTVLLTAADVLLRSPGTLGWAALAALAVFVVSSALGTVPINMQVIDWDPTAPPEDWRRIVARWEAIDVLRSSMAVGSFALLAAAVLY